MVRVAGTTLLVTASHVLDAGELYVCGRAAESRTVPVLGDLVREPLIDVAVVALSTDTEAALAGFHPLSIHQADRRGDRPANGWFAVYGFPCCYEESDPAARVTVCHAVSVQHVRLPRADGPP